MKNQLHTHNSESPVLVLGASPHPARYSYRVIRLLESEGYPIVAIGRRPGLISNTRIVTEVPANQFFHTTTVYLHPDNQEGYENFFFSGKAGRIIFNPGSENPPLYPRLQELNIPYLQACTLVMLTTGQF